jgi:hypothetical protein
MVQEECNGVVDEASCNSSYVAGSHGAGFGVFSPNPAHANIKSQFEMFLDNPAVGWGGTINGTNSTYTENDLVPLRYVLTGIAPSTTYTITIKGDFRRTGTAGATSVHFSDWFGTMPTDAGAVHGQTADPCAGVSVPAGGTACSVTAATNTSIQFPAWDATFGVGTTDNRLPSGDQDVGVLRSLGGGDLAWVTQTAGTGETCGNNALPLGNYCVYDNGNSGLGMKLKFTLKTPAANTGGCGATTCTIVLAYSGHLALGAAPAIPWAFPTGYGAGNWPGGSGHWYANFDGASSDDNGGFNGSGISTSDPTMTTITPTPDEIYADSATSPTPETLVVNVTDTTAGTTNWPQGTVKLYWSTSSSATCLTASYIGTTGNLVQVGATATSTATYTGWSLPWTTPGAEGSIYYVLACYPGNLTTTPLFGPSDGSNTIGVVATSTLVSFNSLKATSEDGGVLVQWRTGFEVRNLGFHIYRDGVRVTTSPIAGSALLAGAKTRMTAGNSYSWFDASGTSSSSYSVEDIDLNGTKTMHGPVSVAAVLPKAGRKLAAERSPLLSQAGRGTSASGVSLLAAAKTATGGGDAAQQAALASGAAVKIAVRTEGWYRVEAAQLIAAGMPASTSPQSLQLFAEGREQAIAVQGTGQVSAIEFYATGLDTIYSDTRVYWLSWSGRQGARAQAYSGKANGAAPTEFPATVQWQPRAVAFPALMNGDAGNIFGPLVGPASSVDQSLAAPHVKAGGVGTLAVTLQGASEGAHEVHVQVNGQDIGSVRFTGTLNYSASFPGVSVQGSNSISLSASGDEDWTLVDTVALTYPHTYEADNDSLRCTAPGGSPVTIGGFASGPIQVVDITDPANPILIQAKAAGQGAISFAGPSGSTRTFLAFIAKATPAGVYANKPSTLQTRQSGADMVMISHADFVDSLAPLKALRQQAGRTVAVVDVEDVYDEFSYGEKNPYAIRSFLANANSVWVKKPHWVLLAGNSTMDPRNYLQTAKLDYVPIEPVGAGQQDTASDDWFVDFDNNGIPEMAIGRLPVQSAAEAQTVVGKIVAFEQAKNAAWKQNALFVAGAGDNSEQFETSTNEARALIPASFNVTKIPDGQGGDAAANTLAALQAGGLFVNYIGHGSTDLWADGLLDAQLAASLANGVKTPFVVSLTCLNGFFIDPYTASLAEALMVANGGAVGVWASSSLTSPDPQAALDKAFISAVFGSAPTVGDAVLAAKAAVTNSDVRKTWILFGDPAMTLK